MNHVSVNLLGRNYQLACDDGQQEHLQQLAKEVSKRLGEFEERYTQSGVKPQETMIWIMTAVTLMDEIYELRRDSAYWQREAINAAAAPVEDPRKKAQEEESVRRLEQVNQQLAMLVE